MPRGNTETVYPRALVLATIRRSLDLLDYRRAFELARTHRIDLNLLHDHHPERFFASVDTLLDSVPDPERLNLFLSMLKYEAWGGLGGPRRPPNAARASLGSPPLADRRT